MNRTGKQIVKLKYEVNIMENYQKDYIKDFLGLGDNPVFNKGCTGVDELSLRLYIGAISFFTIYGLAVSTLVAYMTMKWELSFILILILGLVVPFIGIKIALDTDEWFMSFFGYNLVILGLSAITGPVINHYTSGTVVAAFMATCAVSVVLSIAGVLYPRSLESLGGYLFGGLLALVFVRVGQLILVSLGMYQYGFISLVEYGAAILFSLYIVYDWNRGLEMARTLSNAVKTSLGIYLDIINLFLSLLRLMGNEDE